MDNKLGDIVETSLGRAKVELASADSDGDITCERCILFQTTSCEGFLCSSTSRKDKLNVIFTSLDTNFQGIQNKVQDLYNEIENLKIEFKKEFESRELDLTLQFHEEFPDIATDGIVLSGVYIYTNDFNYQYVNNHWQKF